MRAILKDLSSIYSHIKWWKNDFSRSEIHIKLRAFKMNEADKIYCSISNTLKQMQKYFGLIGKEKHNHFSKNNHTLFSLLKIRSLFQK